METPPLMGYEMMMTYSVPTDMFDTDAWSAESVIAAANAVAAELPNARPARRNELLSVIKLGIVEKFYLLPGNGAGGSLHVVLDDCNLDRENVEWCIEYARKANDAPAIAVGMLLLALTDEERDLV